MTAFTRQEAKAQQQVQQQAKIAQDLRAMFIALDEDGSGTLTREDRPSKSFQVSSLLALYLVVSLSSTYPQHFFGDLKASWFGKWPSWKIWNMQLRVDSSCDLICGASDCRMDLTRSKEFTDVLDDVLFIRQMKAWNILEPRCFRWNVQFPGVFCHDETCNMSAFIVHLWSLKQILFVMVRRSWTLIWKSFQIFLTSWMMVMGKSPQRSFFVSVLSTTLPSSCWYLMI